MGGLGQDLFRSILCFNQVSRVTGISLLCAVRSLFFHSLSCCSLSSGSENILPITKGYATNLCSSGWWDRKLMVVLVEVSLRKMLMPRLVGRLVIERSRNLIKFVDSIVGFSWMLLWMVLIY